MRADRATFLIILRRRLRAPLAREHAVCQLPKSDNGDNNSSLAINNGGNNSSLAINSNGASNVAIPVATTIAQQDRSICGKPLGRHARHSCHCPCGPHRVAAHNSVVNALAHTLGRAGGSVQTERFIPELYMKRSDGTWQEAVMDLAVSWPLAPSLRLLDLTLRSSHYRGAASGAGAAAQHAHAAKHRRYGTSVQPIAIEVGGRMLLAAIETLRRLAVDSHSGRKWQARSAPRLNAHALRRILEWEALRGLALATLASCGVQLQQQCRRRRLPAGADTTQQQQQQQQQQQPQRQTLASLLAEATMVDTAGPLRRPPCRAATSIDASHATPDASQASLAF